MRLPVWRDPDSMQFIAVSFPLMRAFYLDGWGNILQGPAPLKSFRAHLQSYAPKVFPFFKMSPQSGQMALNVFKDPSGVHQVLSRLVDRTKAISEFEIDNHHVHFKVCDSRLESEINFLKRQGIQRIVTLTERHHHKEKLLEHFSLHHLGIEDLGAPKHEQVFELSEILKKSLVDKETVAVHCLAGIGRTSTMLMAAHMAMGLSFDELALALAKRNPSFQMLGAQSDFINSFRKHLEADSE